MRFHLLALTACLFLFIATAAAAKEIEAVSICGASGCHDVDDVHAFMAGGGMDLGSPDEQPTPPLQPYLRIDVEISAPPEENINGWSVFVLADGSLVRSQGPGVGLGQDWVTLPARAAHMIGSAAAGIEPFPAPRLTDVRVGAHRAGEPNHYGDLFGLEAAPRPTTVSPGGWEQIHVRSSVPSPWTDGGDRIDWSPALGVIRVDGLYFEPTSALSERLRVDSGRAASPSDDDGPGLIPWLSALVALGAAAGLFLLRRRRPGPATA